VSSAVAGSLECGWIGPQSRIILARQRTFSSRQLSCRFRSIWVWIAITRMTAAFVIGGSRQGLRGQSALGRHGLGPPGVNKSDLTNTSGDGRPMPTRISFHDLTLDYGSIFYPFCTIRAKALVGKTGRQSSCANNQRCTQEATHKGIQAVPPPAAAKYRRN